MLAVRACLGDMQRSMGAAIGFRNAVSSSNSRSARPSRPHGQARRLRPAEPACKTSLLARSCRHSWQRWPQLAFTSQSVRCPNGCAFIGTLCANKCSPAARMPHASDRLPRRWVSVERPCSRNRTPALPPVPADSRTLPNVQDASACEEARTHT